MDAIYSAVKAHDYHVARETFKAALNEWNQGNQQRIDTMNEFYDSRKPTPLQKEQCEQAEFDCNEWADKRNAFIEDIQHKLIESLTLLGQYFGAQRQDDNESFTYSFVRRYLEAWKWRGEHLDGLGINRSVASLAISLSADEPFKAAANTATPIISKRRSNFSFVDFGPLMTGFAQGIGYKAPKYAGFTTDILAEPSASSGYLTASKEDIERLGFFRPTNASHIIQLTKTFIPAAEYPNHFL